MRARFLSGRPLAVCGKPHIGSRHTPCAMHINTPRTLEFRSADGTRSVPTTRKSMPALAKNLYDYPRYYDLVFGSDWKAEYDFLLEVFDKHAAGRVRRVFEPACGTGRL